MPTDQPDGKGSPKAGPDPDAHAGQGVNAHQPLERTRFGGTDRRPARPDDDAPVSRSDLSKGPEELLEDRSARINWAVLIISSLAIIVFSVWAIFTPDIARAGDPQKPVAFGRL